MTMQKLGPLRHRRSAFHLYGTMGEEVSTENAITQEDSLAAIAAKVRCSAVLPRSWRQRSNSRP